MIPSETINNHGGRPAGRREATPLVFKDMSRFSSRLATLSRAEVMGLTAGAALGLFLGTQVALVILQLFPSFSFQASLLGGLSMGGLAVAGGVIGLRTSAPVWGTLSPVSPAPTMPTAQPKLLDTSTIIDGRIAELCDSGFVEGPLIIPTCVLGELQAIADSSIADKRARGKRGLGVLARLQKIDGLTIHSPDSQTAKDQPVDWQLIHLAKAHQAKLMTNDWNLGKIAALQGVRVLSVNEVCHGLQPAVLPGDALRVYLFKEGQSPHQAIAHLDDGTLVVVDQAQRLLGTNVDIIVNSLHQTSSGIIIFASLHHPPGNGPAGRPKKERG